MTPNLSDRGSGRSLMINPSPPTPQMIFAWLQISSYTAVLKDNGTGLVTSAIQPPATPGYDLWTEALHSSPSSQLCNRTNSPWWEYTIPPAGDSPTCCLTRDCTWHWENISLTPWTPVASPATPLSYCRWHHPHRTPGPGWLWTSEGAQPHAAPSTSVTPQLTLWSWTSVPSQNIKKTAEDKLPVATEEIQPAKDDNGALLLYHHSIHSHLLYHLCCHLVHHCCCYHDGADCRASFTLPQRLFPAMCKSSRTFTPPGLEGTQVRLWLICLTLYTISHHKNAFFPPATGVTDHARDSPLTGNYLTLIF